MKEEVDLNLVVVDLNLMEVHFSGGRFYMLFVGCSFSFLKREIWNLKLGARSILGHWFTGGVGVLTSL